MANSLPEALCGTASVPVAQMAASEKLCRSFALGLVGVPDATLREARVLLTPENLAAMSALSGIWMASQGVPVVGEGVDAALATLGIILLASQVAELSNALWQYASLAATAQSLEQLRAASAHFARAVALVGVNIVTFILTTQVSSRAGRQSPPREPSLKPATQGGPLHVEPGRNSGASIHPDAVAAQQVKPPIAVPAAEAAVTSSSSKVFAVNALVKRISPTAFKSWLAEAPRKLATGDDLARRFQRAHAGEEELLVQGGGARIWADGVSHPDAHLVEVKHIKDAATSPFIEGSKCPEVVRAKIRKEVSDEFERYAAIIKDSETPAAGLEVITNNAEAASHFASLMKRLDIPGRVRVITGGTAP
ncbi:restriction endonuclease fold toxin-2 domain-containing protein [Cystobacter fuscus]